jgi:hypothetical protein
MRKGCEAMTVEERAQLMLKEIPNQKPWEGKEELKAKFAKHLRDQIEDRAKVADDHERIRKRQSHMMMAIQANEIGAAIRALVEPEEEKKKRRKERRVKR